MLGCARVCNVYGCVFECVCTVHVQLHACVCMHVCVHIYRRRPSGLKLAKSWISNSDNRSKKLKSPNFATGSPIDHYIGAPYQI